MKVLSVVNAVIYLPVNDAFHKIGNLYNYRHSPIIDINYLLSFDSNFELFI